MGDVEKPNYHRVTSTVTETGRMILLTPAARRCAVLGSPRSAKSIVARSTLFKSTLAKSTFAVSVLAAFIFAAPPSPARAEPLVTQGIGTSSCARLAADINPAEGLNNPLNVMLYAWVQGYVSAANISLLEGDSRHVDMSGLDETKVLNLVVGYCKANPDKKPVTAIDDMIRKAAKIKTKWEAGTIDWDE
jgi:hypothetical protein